VGTAHGKHADTQDGKPRGSGGISGIKVRAAGLLFDRGRILLVRHTKKQGSYWVIPGGGIEPGESVVSALEREMKEELGLGIKAGNLLFLDEVIRKEAHNIDLYFDCTLNSKADIILEKGSSVSGFGFFSRKDMDSLEIRPPVHRILKRVWRSKKFHGFTSYVV
jgi:8-oxo-dGTP diphosphatase